MKWLMTFTKQSQRVMGVEEDATEASSERKGREWEKGLRSFFEGEKKEYRWCGSEKRYHHHHHHHHYF